MINCQRYQKLLSAYSDNELKPAQIPFVETHLNICPRCQTYLRDLQHIKSLYQRISRPVVQEQDWARFELAVSHIHSPPKHHKLGIAIGIRYAATVLLTATIAICFFLMDFGSQQDWQETDSHAYDLSNVPFRISSARARKDPTQTEIIHKPIEVSPNLKQASAQFKGLAQAKFSPAELEFLNNHGFVVTSRQFNSFVELYRDNQKSDIPSFVTIDTVISGFSHILARLRVDLEEEIFLKKLTALTKILREQLLFLHHEMPPDCKEASFQALAFIKVGCMLLNCDDVWPYEIEQVIKDRVANELALIYNGRDHREVGIQKSFIFDYDIDYNKFKIRWDETESDHLRNYYLAMEWYSRCVFRTTNVLETQSALLLLMAAIAEPSDGIILWDEMNQLLTALYGQVDDSHLMDYQETAREIFGDIITPKILLDKKKIQQFCRAIDRRKLPRIRSEVGLKGGLRIFGGRYYDRDFILQEFCYPYISSKGDPRVIPSLLDIAIIIGHPKAYELATQRDDFRFTDYRSKIETYRNDLDQKIGQIAKPWERGGLISDSWVYRPLLYAEGRGYPTFCKSDAWQARKLSSLLCGIVHLSNSRPTFAGADIQKFEACVDPYPEFFNRMLTTIRNLEKLLLLVGYPMTREPGEEISRYKKALQEVMEISTKMLAGEILSAEDQKKLGNFVLGWQGEYHEATISELSTLFHRNHTDYDCYFHAGIEPARELWVICPGNPMPFLARGAVNLLYEFPTGTKVLPNDWRKAKLWKTVQEKMGMEAVAPWLRPFIIPE